MSLNVEDALSSISETITKAAKPHGDKKPPFLQRKFGPKAKSIADSISAEVEKLGEGKAGPVVMRRLTTLRNRLSTLLGDFPAERTTKVVEMSAEEFRDHAQSEVKKAMGEKDPERLALLQMNVEDVAKFGALDDGQIAVEVFDAAIAPAGDFSGLADDLKTATEQLVKATAKPDEKADPKADPKADAKPDADPKKADAKKADEDPAEPAEGDKKPTEKADGGCDWPLDLNDGHSKDDVQKWGRVNKSDISFGSDGTEATS